MNQKMIELYDREQDRDINDEVLVSMILGIYKLLIMNSPNLIWSECDSIVLSLKY